MNLEKLNLVELSAQEVQEVEGGFLQLIAAYLLWETVGNPKASYDAFMRGYNS